MTSITQVFSTSPCSLDNYIPVSFCCSVVNCCLMENISIHYNLQYLVLHKLSQNLN